MTKVAKNLLFLLLSTLVGIVLMYWTLRGFDPEQLATFFNRRSNYVWISLTLMAGVGANLLRSLRWRMLLVSAGVRVSRRRAIELVFIAYLINSVTPRLGELVRALLVKRGNSEISSRALGTVVVEKAADVGCLIILLAIALSLRWQATVDLVGGTTEHVAGAGPRIAAAILSVMALTGALCCLKPLRQRIAHFLSGLWRGVSAIAHLRNPLGFAALCGGIWFCNFLQLYLLIPCFDTLSAIDLTGAVHLFAVVSVGALLPTPAGAGPWHFAIVRTLTTIYGIGRQAAQSYALITHGLKTVLVILLGLAGYASYYSSVWRKWRKSS